jgi:hypothetical protein
MGAFAMPNASTERRQRCISVYVGDVCAIKTDDAVEVLVADMVPRTLEREDVPPCGIAG